MSYNYFYDTGIKNFSHIAIPKSMISDPAFSELSIHALFLYGILLDRMRLSMKNDWFDDFKRVYIIYSIKEIMETMRCTKRKAMEYLKELESLGLVQKKKRACGLPSILYVKNFMSLEDDSGNVTSTSNSGSEKARGIKNDTSSDTDSYDMYRNESEVRKSELSGT